MSTLKIKLDVYFVGVNKQNIDNNNFYASLGFISRVVYRYETVTHPHENDIIMIKVVKIMI